MTTKMRVQTMQARGHLLLGDRVVAFNMDVDWPKIEASFESLPEGMDVWQAFRLLEEFVQDKLRG